MGDNPKKPKKLELTEPPPKKPEEGDEGISPPVSIELKDKRHQYYQSLEDRFRKDRIELIKDIQQQRDSKIFVFYSHDTLDIEHAEIFFEFLQEIGEQQKLELFLLSPGGFSDHAFNMSRWCRQYANQFSVIIPHYAKSAATLLCLGADTLLMGHSSELGPIDPQIPIPDEYGRLMQVSALSIKDALKSIENLTEGNQDKALKYMPLIGKIDLNVFGQYDRAIQSAKQYASELLKMSGLLDDKEKCEIIANKLTEGYHSHGYAIGADEARELGFNVVCPGDNDFDQKVWKSIWRLHKMYDDMMKNSHNERPLAENLLEYRQVMTVLEADTFSLPMKKTFIKNLSQKHGKK